jgi:hypothetical protein
MIGRTTISSLGRGGESKTLMQALTRIPMLGLVWARARAWELAGRGPKPTTKMMLMLMMWRMKVVVMKARLRLLRRTGSLQL